MRLRLFRSAGKTPEVGCVRRRSHCLTETAPRRFDATVASCSCTVVATNLELGAHNQVYIRGQGGGLTWDHGQPLKCFGKGTWVWSTNIATGNVEFQLLLDDLVWERNEPHVLERGRTIQFTPDFEWPEIPRTSCPAVHS
jgi:hypothetical protein